MFLAAGLATMSSANLEEVEYLQQTGQPGCMVFKDFSKANDRLSRPWVRQCMSSMGFGQNASKCIMLQNTSMVGDQPAFQSAQVFSKAAHCRRFSMC